MLERARTATAVGHRFSSLAWRVCCRSRLSPPPEIAVPPSFPASSGGESTAKAGRADLDRWWRTLQDRQLNAIIERAIQSNPDIDIALTRVQAARTQEIVVVGAALPKVNVGAAAAAGTGTDLVKGRVPQSIDSGTNTTGLRVSRVAGFDAGWELDIFGKYQRLLEAAQADAEALMELRNAVLITVVAEVVRNYIDVRGLQARLEIARADVATGQNTLDLVQTRYNRGLTNELDVTLANRQLATLQARLPELTAAISAAESRLAVLLGTYPGAIESELRRAGPLPRIPPRLRAGIPVDLLRRRPDIRRAERELAGATARIGVATADLFPSVALLAGFGAQGGERQTGTAVPIHGPIWSFGPGAYWPFLDFGRLDALIDIQEMREHEQLMSYKKAILVAVAEVDDAIKQFRAQQQRLKDLAVALGEGRRAVTLATERYERGLTDFLNVLDAQRQQYELEDQNAIAQEVLTLQLIVFYKALGGGWESYEVLPRSPKPSRRCWRPSGGYGTTGTESCSVCELQNHDQQLRSEPLGDEEGQLPMPKVLRRFRRADYERHRREIFSSHSGPLPRSCVRGCERLWESDQSHPGAGTGVIVGRHLDGHRPDGGDRAQGFGLNSGFPGESRWYQHGWGAWGSPGWGYGSDWPGRASGWSR